MTDQLAIDFTARLAANGVTLKVRNNRLWLLPGRAYKDLSDEDRAFLRHHRAELKLIAERGVPVAKVSSKPAPKPEEPEPEVYAYNHHITSHDVNEAMEALGDDALADYRAGRITKVEAYEMARHHKRQTLQMGGQSAGWQHFLLIT